MTSKWLGLNMQSPHNITKPAPLTSASDSAMLTYVHYNLAFTLHYITQNYTTSTYCGHCTIANHEVLADSSASRTAEFWAEMWNLHLWNLHASVEYLFLQNSVLAGDQMFQISSFKRKYFIFSWLVKWYVYGWWWWPTISNTEHLKCRVQDVFTREIFYIKKNSKFGGQFAKFWLQRKLYSAWIIKNICHSVHKMFSNDYNQSLAQIRIKNSDTMIILP